MKTKKVPSNKRMLKSLLKYTTIILKYLWKILEMKQYAKFTSTIININ